MNEANDSRDPELYRPVNDSIADWMIILILKFLDRHGYRCLQMTRYLHVIFHFWTPTCILGNIDSLLDFVFI